MPASRSRSPPDELRVVDGCKKVFAALQAIEKVGMIKANEAFDVYFKQSYRKKERPDDGQLLATAAPGLGGAPRCGRQGGDE